MPRHLLYPLWLDMGNAAPEQTCGLDQLGRQYPAPRFLAQMRAGVAVELDAACTQVHVFILELAAHIAQQARQHRQVQLFVGRGSRIDMPLVLGHHRLELRMDVFPLAYPAHTDEVLPQQLFVLAIRRAMLGTGQPQAGRSAPGVQRRCGARRLRASIAAGVRNPLPQFEIPGELAFLVVELDMRRIGGSLRIHRSVAHVLHAERTGDDQHLVERLALARLQNHAPDTRVQREAGELLSDAGEFVVVVHRAQLGQQLIPVGNGAGLRLLDKRKVFHHAQMQGLHAQDHTRQRAAQNFRLGEARALVKVLLVVEADTNAIGHAPATSGALVRRRLADRLDQQLLDLATKAVALHACGAGVDHVPDAWHGERGLRHVGRQHDPPPGMPVENTLLFGLAQAREQRQHLGPAQYRQLREMFAQVVRRFANFALAGQEHQDVAAVVQVAPQLVHAIGNGIVQVVLARFLERSVTLFHREHAPGNHDDRRWR